MHDRTAAGSRLPPRGLPPLALLLVVSTLGAYPAALRAQPAAGSAAAPAAASETALSAAQLDQLTAPIALYPDALLGQILVAATYPLEVVEADRWQQDPAHTALRGAALRSALQQQPWDDSIKALVPFSAVLAMMDRHLDWTELLGDTFLSQQGALMDSVQRLRARAAAAGSLVSTPQQNITTIGSDVEIEPASAADAYVPYYDPNTVYGSWPWPDDPPYQFALPADVAITLGGATVIGFGPPVPLLWPIGGWPQWQWRRHQLQVGSLGAAQGLHPWHHNPRHRLGVPYRSAALSARYQARSQAGLRARRSGSRPPPRIAAPTWHPWASPSGSSGFSGGPARSFSRSQPPFGTAAHAFGRLEPSAPSHATRAAPGAGSGGSSTGSGSVGIAAPAGSARGR